MGQPDEEGRLFSARQVIVASLLGSLLSGASLMALNLHRRGRTPLAWVVLALGVVLAPVIVSQAVGGSLLHLLLAWEGSLGRVGLQPGDVVRSGLALWVATAVLSGLSRRWSPGLRSAVRVGRRHGGRCSCSRC